jgi:prepilin-type N-terminal cleavage/methylation domain-containing protein
MTIQENSKPDQAGFTLIEALLAMVILAFGLIAITNLLIVAASSNSVGNMSSAATALASQQLELLKAQSYTSIAPGGSITADQSVAGVPYFRDDSIDGVATFHTRWAIVQIAGDQQTRFIKVRTEPAPGLFRSRAAAEFTSFRSCTSVASGCPAP